MIIEGMLALTGQNFIISLQRGERNAPGFVEGFNKVARDEQRHVAFGARSCARWRRRASATGDAITRTLTGGRARRPTAC
jgi:ribonucleoside-diphosphate reductase beta chain